MVAIEPAANDALDRLVDLWVELAAEQRTYRSHLFAEENRTEVQHMFARHIVADDVLVARKNAELVGFITFSVESGTYAQDVTRGIVSNVYVEPGHRDAGVGTELLESAEAILRDRGVDALALEVMADNDASRRFYRRHGYRPHRIELEKRAENDTLTKE
ncbi:GNAT family N-acetyltransferase [Halorussus halophilus]|uniref:GNAT family N-acetyltransferase n=1 Tax=Halorussus halophilus TaxID=2650975 RepID=UPI00130111E2|nr:GNAT family N-acetyltransferase [Halorussus halophilus]